MSALPTVNVTSTAAGVYNNSGTNKGKILLIWDWDYVAYPDITWTLETSIANANTWTTTTIIGGGTSTYLTNLNLNTSYDWRIKASADGYDDSPYTTGVIAIGAAPTTGGDITAPGAVSALNISTPGSVTITWSMTSTRYTRMQLTLSTSGEADRIVTASDLQRTITVASLTVGKHYSILLTPLAILAAGTITGTNTLTGGVDVLVAGAFWYGPTTLQLTQGALWGGLWTLYAAGTVFTGTAKPTLGPLPPGITATDGLETYDPRRLIVTGTPTQEGIFPALVSGIVKDVLGSVSTYSLAVTFAVSGPLCIGWFHMDSTRCDLQLRATRGVYSFHSGDSTEGTANLRLTRGDTRRVYLFQRDLALNLIVPALTAASLTVRLKNRRDGIPLLTVRTTGAVPTEAIGDQTVPYLDLTPEGDFLDLIFDRLNANHDAADAVVSLECEGELVLTPTAGNTVSSTTFPVFIQQDSDR